MCRNSGKVSTHPNTPRALQLVKSFEQSLTTNHLIKRAISVYPIILSNKCRSMRATINLLLAGLAVSIFNGCSTSVTISSYYDRSVQFGKYKSYALIASAGGQKLPALSEQALRNSLRSELSPRGITEASGEKADLEIVCHIVPRKEFVSELYMDWDYGYQGGWPSGPGGFFSMSPEVATTYNNANRYLEGTLILDFVDARKKRLVFRGAATSVNRDLLENTRIREAVAKIVAAYPQ